MTKTTKSKSSSEESAVAFLKRSATGTTFLTLEHVMHKLLLVALSVTIVFGSSAALTLWANSLTVGYSLFWSTHIIYLPYGAICLAAVLFTLSPLVWFLDTRIRAEFPKRAGYPGRLGYKAPLYTAIGVLSIFKITAFALALSVLLYLLAEIGTSATAAEVWAMSLSPALIALLVFGVTSWYLIQLAKGRDDGRNFNAAIATVGLLLGLVLFVSASISLDSARAPSLDRLWMNDKGTKYYIDDFSY